LLWYAKNIPIMKFNKLVKARTQQQVDTAYINVQLLDGNIRNISPGELEGTVELPKGMFRFRPSQLYSQTGGESSRFTFEFEGRPYGPPQSGGWRTKKE